MGLQFFSAILPALSSGLWLQHVTALSPYSDWSLTWPSWWRGWPGVLRCPLKFRKGEFLPFVIYAFLEETTWRWEKLPSDPATIYKYYRYVNIIFIQETPGLKTSWRFSLPYLLTYLQILNDFPTVKALGWNMDEMGLEWHKPLQLKLTFSPFIWILIFIYKH